MAVALYARLLQLFYLTHFFFSVSTQANFYAWGVVQCIKNFQHAGAVLRSEGDMKKKIGLVPLNCGYQVVF